MSKVLLMDFDYYNSSDKIIIFILSLIIIEDY